MFAQRGFNCSNNDIYLPPFTFKHIARSPVFAHTNATISGLSTIRSANAQKLLSKQFDTHMDTNISACFLFVSALNALACWLEFLCAIYMTVALGTFLFIGKGTDFTIHMYSTVNPLPL